MAGNQYVFLGFKFQYSHFLSLIFISKTAIICFADKMQFFDLHIPNVSYFNISAVNLFILITALTAQSGLKSQRLALIVIS